MGKVKQIVCRDWLPMRSRWSYLACSALPVTHVPLFVVNAYNNFFICQACSVKVAGFCLHSFCMFMDRVFAKKHTQKTLANILPS